MKAKIYTAEGFSKRFSDGNFYIFTKTYLLSFTYIQFWICKKCLNIRGHRDQMVIASGWESEGPGFEPQRLQGTSD